MMDHRTISPSNDSHRIGSWSLSEDQRLRHAVDRFAMNWGVVAPVVGTRNGEQCSKRWKNALNPHLDLGPWTNDEDCLLQQLVLNHGRNWKLIAEYHPKNRAALALKNRYSLLLRREKRREKRRDSQRHGNTSSLNLPSLPGKCGGVGTCGDGLTHLEDPSMPLASFLPLLSCPQDVEEYAGLDLNLLCNESTPSQGPHARPTPTPVNVRSEFVHPPVNLASMDWTDVAMDSHPSHPPSVESDHSSGMDAAKQEIISFNIPCSKSRRLRLVQSLLGIAKRIVSEGEERGEGEGNGNGEEISDTIQVKMIAVPKSDLRPGRV